ncbi:MAG: hypothetical protein AAFX44_19475 [Pseudomonadota bacterium]
MVCSGEIIHATSWLLQFGHEFELWVILQLESALWMLPTAFVEAVVEDWLDLVRPVQRWLQAVAGGQVDPAEFSYA